jgi:hypothetical protein
MRPRKSLKWIKIQRKQSVKKQEISKKPRLIISIPLNEESVRSVQPVNESSLSQSKKSLTVSINLEVTSELSQQIAPLKGQYNLKPLMY